MKYGKFGEVFTDTNELCDLLYKNPALDISNFNVTDPEIFNTSVKELHAELPILQQYVAVEQSVEDFDSKNQQHWFMPQEYYELDIAKWLLDQCKEDHELQRVGQELLLFQERDLFNLLKFLKYLVDTLRKNNIVWGVGRGSSVASYVLYLIGVHKINSIYYDLDVTEFLK